MIPITVVGVGMEILLLLLRGMDMEIRRLGTVAIMVAREGTIMAMSETVGSVSD
jgi:hypothetical protein